MTAVGIIMWWSLMKSPKIFAALIVGVPSYLIFFLTFRTAPAVGGALNGRGDEANERNKWLPELMG
jgi:hypothetical protein